MLRLLIFSIGILLLGTGIAYAAPAAPIIGGAIAGALGLGAIGTAIASVAISIGLSYAINRAFAPSRPQVALGDYRDPGVKQRLPSDPANKLPVIYGTKRARGTLIHAAISSDNQRMAFILALCEGPVQSIGSPRWDDTTCRVNGSFAYQQTENANGATGNLYDVTAVRGNFGEGDEETNFLTNNMRFAFYPKGSTRCTYMENFDVNGWGDSERANRTMPNMAYVYIELDYDRDEGVTGLAQDLSFEVQGRLVRDFDSDGLTNAAASWSDNPARCVMDYLLNDRYGAELGAIDVDFNSMNEWKNFCDETNISGSPQPTHKRYTCNGAVNTNDQRDTVLSDLFLSASGTLTYSLGKFGVIIDRPDTEIAFNFSTENIYGDVEISNSGFDNIINKITLRYDEIQDRDQESQVILETPASIRHANEPTLERTTRSVFSNNRIEAERLATIAINKARRTQLIRIKTDLRALAVQAGDIVRFDYELYEIANYEYRVLTIEEARISNTDANGSQYDMPGLELTMVRYFAVDYSDTDVLDFVPAPNTNYPSTRRFPDSDAYNLAGRAFNSDTDTENFASPYVELTWTNPAGFLIEYYTIYESPNSSFSDAVPVGVARPAVGSVYADNAAILQHVNNVRVNSPYFFVVPGNSFGNGRPSDGVLVAYNPVLGRDGASIVVVYGDSESVEFCNSVTISGSTTTSTRRDNPFDRSIDVNGSYTAQFGDKYLTLNGETSTSTYTVQNAGREGYLSFYNSAKNLSIVGVERTDEAPIRTALPLHWYIVKGNFAADSDWNLGRTSALSNRNIVTPRLTTVASNVPDSDILATAGGGTISCDTEISMMSIFYNQSFSPGQRGWVNFYSYTGTLPTLPIGNTGWVSYSGAAGTSVFIAYAPRLDYLYVPPADTEPVLTLNSTGTFLSASFGFNSNHLIIAPAGWAANGTAATNSLTQNGNTKVAGSTDDSTIKWRSRSPVNLNTNPSQSGFYRPTNAAYSNDYLYDRLSTRVTYSPQPTDAQTVNLLGFDFTGLFEANPRSDAYWVIVKDDGTQSGQVIFKRSLSEVSGGQSFDLSSNVTLTRNESIYMFIEDSDYHSPLNQNSFGWGDVGIRYADADDTKLIPTPGTASTTIRDTDNFIGTFRGFNEPNILTAAGLAMYDWAEYTGTEGASIWTIYATDNDGSNPSLTDSDFITTANVTKTRSIPTVLNSTNPTGNTDSETQLFSSFGNLTWDTDDGLCMFNALSNRNEFVTNRTYTVRGAEAYDSDAVVGVSIVGDTTVFTSAPSIVNVSSGGALTINQASNAANMGSGVIMVTASRSVSGTPVQQPDTEVLFTVGSAFEGVQFDGSGPGSGSLYLWERSDSAITGGTTNMSESRATQGQWHQWRTSSSGRFYNSGTDQVTVTSVRVQWTYRSNWASANAARVVNSTGRVEVRSSAGTVLGATPTRGFNPSNYYNDTINITDTTIGPNESIYLVFAVIDRGTHPAGDPAWNNSSDSVSFGLQSGSSSIELDYHVTHTPITTETGEATFNAGDAISAGTPAVYAVASSDIISSTFVSGNTYNQSVEVTRGVIQRTTRYRNGNNYRLLGTFLGQHATRDGNCWRVPYANVSRTALTDNRDETRIAADWSLAFNYNEEFDTEEVTTLSRDFVCFYSSRGQPVISGPDSDDLSHCEWSRINISGAETEVEISNNVNNIIDLSASAIELRDGGLYGISYTTTDSETGVAVFTTPINRASVMPAENSAALNVAVAPLMAHDGTILGTLLLTYTVLGSEISYTALTSSNESVRLITLWKRLE